MRIAVLNFFPAFFPPKSGGELRYYHLYRELGLHCDVELISMTYPFVQPESVPIGNGVVDHRIPKGSTHVALHRLLDLVSRFEECSGVVVAVASRFERAVREEIRRRCEGADVVIYDFPFLYPLAKPSHSGALVVYGAHNVEFDLQRACLPGPVGWWLSRYVRRLENRICQQADLVFSPSNADISRLVELYRIPPQKCHLAPNGVSLAEIPVPSDIVREQSRSALGLDKTKLVLFVGSHHPPNLQAARHILGRLAPAFPSVLFVIAGGVARGLTDQGPPANVLIVGRFSEDAKRLLLTAADVAVNPMFSGSGTNLKTLEYLAYGVPTVTTPLGARGLDLSSGVHALVADEVEFPDALDRLLRAKDLRSHLRSSGRRLVEERFDWREIAAAMYSTILASLEKREKPQVTVLNEFPCFPPTHGGKIRLYRFYSSLSAYYDIDYVCYDGNGSRTPTVCQLPAKGIREIRVPKTWLQVVLERLFRDALGCGADDIVAMLVAPFDRRFRRITSYSMQRSRLVIASHIYLYAVAARFKGRTIYDSLNCEYVLKRELLTSRLGRALLPLIKRLEARACRESFRIFATCDEDVDEMVHLYGIRKGKCLPVPNGVSVDLCRPIARERRREAQRRLGLPSTRIVTFVGSAHPPNAEAVRWISAVLAPSLGAGYLVFLVGGACWALDPLSRPPNLVPFYEVEDAVKDDVLRLTDVAINPIISGSGTNLKMLEYMAWGLPVVATPKGVRGLALAQNVHAVVTDRENFAKAIRSLASDPERCESIGASARALVETQFDWNRIAASTFFALLSGGKDAESASQP